MELLQTNSDHIRAVAVNTRCANACTGEQGIANAKQMAQLTADAVGVSAGAVVGMWTGVIGNAFDGKSPTASNPSAALSETGWDDAALGDHRHAPQVASVTVTTADGRSYTVAGIAKGGA